MIARPAGHRLSSPIWDQRTVDRDEVSYRTLMTGGARAETVHVVNISPHGLMARSNAEMAPAQRLIFRLPRVHHVEAELSWALGGRFGVRFVRPIAAGDYLVMLAEMLKLPG